MIVLRALGALLSYPREEVRQALPEIADAIRASPLIAAREREGLLALIDDLRTRDLLEAEERYVDLFDRGRATSLHLFEHLHGEARDRGQAMVDLKRLYERAGYELSSRELPDYLPVILEYLSCCDLRETRALLGDCAHILKRIGQAPLQPCGRLRRADSSRRCRRWAFSAAGRIPPRPESPRLCRRR
jgi:nitrate reductase molybdenum cofactor assembly chaperone NarJ/NarW